MWYYKHRQYKNKTIIHLTSLHWIQRILVERTFETFHLQCCVWFSRRFDRHLRYCVIIYLHNSKQNVKHKKEIMVEIQVGSTVGFATLHKPADTIFYRVLDMDVDLFKYARQWCGSVSRLSTSTVSLSEDLINTRCTSWCNQHLHMRW